MERSENQETTTSIPLIARLDRLDRALQIFEEKHNSISLRRDACEVESNNDRKTLSSALEEVQHKGTLIDRLTLLENRVFQLSGNTSKSSSSTFQVSKTTLKDSCEITAPKKQDHCLDFKAKQMQVSSTIEQGRTYTAHGFVKENAVQLKSGQKKKPKKRCLRMFQLRC